MTDWPTIQLAARKETRHWGNQTANAMNTTKKTRFAAAVRAQAQLEEEVVQQQQQQHRPQPLLIVSFDRNVDGGVITQ